MKSIKSRCTPGFVVVSCSSLAVVMFIVHVYSSQDIKIGKGSMFHEELDKDLSTDYQENTIDAKINMIKSVINTLKADIKVMKSDINMIKFDKNKKTKYQSNPEGKGIALKNRTILTSPPHGTLLSSRQIAAITHALPAAGNLLVWGLGNDSPFWHDRTKGKVIFIEPKGFWFENITGKYPFLEAYSVNYTTDLLKAFDKYINDSTIWSDLDLRSQLPPIVSQTPWDVIIVDAPPGFGNGPGRYQSIYTSSLIAQNGTHIFVDDFERKVEREYSLKMLGTPVEVVPRKDAENALRGNQLAHFIHTLT